MYEKYSDAIHNSVRSTSVYNGKFWDDKKIEKNHNVSFSVETVDTVSSLFRNRDKYKRIAILNFASYKHPGGGFIVGSQAQEESLCHESFLYNILKEFNGYYMKNSEKMNSGLYSNRALYSKDVYFERCDNVAICDVITCAAPNFSFAKQFVSRDINDKILKDRIRFILEIVKSNKIDAFITGAFGCGVFQQDPTTVANLFITEALDTFVDRKIDLIFATPIINNKLDNVTPFEEAVNNLNKNKNNGRP